MPGTQAVFRPRARVVSHKQVEKRFDEFWPYAGRE
jgi:hypothetical protein